MNNTVEAARCPSQIEDFARQSKKDPTELIRGAVDKAIRNKNKYIKKEDPVIVVALDVDIFKAVQSFPTLKEAQEFARLSDREARACSTSESWGPHYFPIFRISPA